MVMLMITTAASTMLSQQFFPQVPHPIKHMGPGSLTVRSVAQTEQKEYRRHPEESCQKYWIATMNFTMPPDQARHQEQGEHPYREAVLHDTPTARAPGETHEADAEPKQPPAGAQTQPAKQQAHEK